MRCAVIALAFVVSLAMASISNADEVRVNGGSVVHGRIVSIAAGKLKIETEFAGELEIPMNKVIGIATDEPRKITVGDMPAFEGRLSVDDTYQELRRNGSMRPFDLKSLTAVEDLDGTESSTPQANWKGRAEVGLNGKSGNTDRLDGRALVSTTRVAEASRLTLSLRGAYSEVEGSRSQNEVLGSLLYERDLTDRLFAFGRLEAEYDEFEDLDIRATAAAGLGYFLLRSNRQELKIRGGLAYQHERFSNGESDDNFLGELGYDYRLDIRKWLRYTSVLTYTVEPGMLESWRIDAENAAEIPLSQTTGWKIRFGVRNEYDNMPQPGIESMDTSYYAALVYNWN